MIRIITSFLLLLLLLWLTAIWVVRCQQQTSIETMPGISREDAATMKPEYLPIENPKPKFFMTVSGKVEPALLKSLNSERVTATYRTYNEACMYDAAGGFEGAMTHRERSLNYQIKTDPKDGRFIVKVPLDQLLPGYCKWQLTVVTYYFCYASCNNNIQHVPEGYIAYFGLPAVQPNSGAFNKWACDDKSCKFFEGKDLTDKLQSKLSPYRNCDFQIYFSKKGAKDGNDSRA